MSDDEWFTTYCGVKAAMFADTVRYKSDALLYRRIVDERAAFRAKVKGAVKETRDGKVMGPFYSLLNKVISITHPKDWAICGTCGGKGVHPNKPTEKCPTCYGTCYQTKTEAYL
jgi:hypothetical protein